MKVKVENVENKANEVKLEITVEAEKFDEAIQNVYKKNAKYFSIPGFRKGKAPFKMVEKAYGIQIFYEDAFNDIAGDVHGKALEENKIEAVSKPEIDIVQIESGKDLIFTAVVQTKPEVTLGKYKGIEIKKVEYNVSDEDIEHELSHIAEHNARLVAVEDRPVENGDTTIIDFETAKKLPIIWEVMRSYSYIDKDAKDGNLNIDTLVEYVKEFSKFVKLNKYDLKYAAHMYLIQIVSSVFGYKQYNDDYQKTGLLQFAFFRTNLCRFLYENLNKISSILQKEILDHTKE